MDGALALLSDNRTAFGYWMGLHSLGLVFLRNFYLALLGGGAISGGLGMAGGTIAIMVGGAIIAMALVTVNIKHT